MTDPKGNRHPTAGETAIGPANMVGNRLSREGADFGPAESAGNRTVSGGGSEVTNGDRHPTAGETELGPANMLGNRLSRVGQWDG